MPNIGLIHPKPGLEFLNAFEGRLRNAHENARHASPSPACSDHHNACLPTASRMPMPLRWRGSWQRSSGPRSGPVNTLAMPCADRACPSHDPNPNYGVSRGDTKTATTYLLPHLHDLEALKVVQSPPLLDGRTLLCP